MVKKIYMFSDYPVFVLTKSVNQDQELGCYHLLLYSIFRHQLDTSSPRSAVEVSTVATSC